MGIPVATRTWLWGERSEWKPQAQTAETLTSLPLGTRGLQVPAPPCSPLTRSPASHFSFFPVLFFLRKKEPVSSGGHVAWVGVRPGSYDRHMASAVKGPHRISFLFSTQFVHAATEWGSRHRKPGTAELWGEHHGQNPGLGGQGRTTITADCIRVPCPL